MRNLATKRNELQQHFIAAGAPFVAPKPTTSCEEFVLSGVAVALDYNAFLIALSRSWSPPRPVYTTLPALLITTT